MKKVLYIHHGDINGGAPRSLKFILERMDSQKYDATVVCRTSLEDAEFFKVPSVSKVILEKNIRPFHGSVVSGINFKQIIYNFVYALPTYFATKKILKEVKPDIVHLNSTCLFMCARACKKVNKDIKVICHIREPLLPNFWGTLLRKGVFKPTDKFIAIDKFDCSTVDRKNKKSTVIYNFVDFKTYNTQIKSDVLRKELNLSNDDVIFLCLCRISPENGITDAVKTWATTNIPSNAHLVIVGEIKDRQVEYTQKCHELATDKQNIHFLPFRKDIPDVIASSDIMLCSFAEPHFSRAIIEGAAMGKPAISKYIDGPKELVMDKKTGLFYDDKNNKLEDCVALIMDKSLREKLGAQAEKYALDNFNAEINAENTFREYE